MTGDAPHRSRRFGSGPPLVVPRCNFAWDGFAVDRLAEHFTVLVVTPRGYGDAGRLVAPDRYSAEMLAADVLAACTEAGIDHFATFGYSFTGAVAAWLARVSDRVDAVVAGGFPLLADYGRLLRRAQAQPAGGVDPANFDIGAATAFYERLAEMAAGALVDECPRPLLTFWGGSDSIIEETYGLDALREGILERGVPHLVVDGEDHGSMLEHLDRVLPEVVAFLQARGAAGGGGR